MNPPGRSDERSSRQSPQGAFETSAPERASGWPAAVPMTLMLYALLLMVGGLSLAWNLIAMLLYPVLPQRTGQAIGRAAIAHIYRVFWSASAALGMLRLDAGVLDALRQERGLIVVANHPSLLDALILVARLPRSACIMKASLMRNVFLGAGARLARYVSNKAPLTMVRLAVRDLKQGGQLVMFPEGTRTTTAPLNAFLPGVTLIAKLAKVPIQTVFIDTSSSYAGKGWPLWKLPPLPVVFSVRLGERFAPSADADALLRELELYYRQGLESPVTTPEPTATTCSPTAPDPHDAAAPDPTGH